MGDGDRPVNGDGSLPAAYRVELESFQGPLDLLLHLIRKNELDICDIPVSEITRQYIAYLDMMKELDLEIASEFLVMASTLMYIKSRMLLPVDEEEDEGEGADPREELIRRLIEYQKYKKAAEDLAGRPVLHHDIFVRPEPESGKDYPTDENFTEATLFQLMDAFKKVISEADKRTPVEVTREAYTLEDGIRLIESRLADKGSSSFEGLFTELDTRRKVITVFLGLLELIRRRRVIAVQADYGGPISLVPNSARPGVPEPEAEKEGPVSDDQ